MTQIPARETEPQPSGERRGARGPYAKGVKRRQQILDQTLDVVAERGIDATSLRAIGAAIGVSHGVLTNYFDSREKLLLEVVEQRDNQTRDRLISHGLFDRLAEAAHLNAEVPEFIALYTTLLAMSVEKQNVVASEFFRDRFDKARKETIETIRNDAALANHLPDTESEKIASLVIAAFDGLQIQWLLDRDLDIASTLRLLSRLFQHVCTCAEDGHTREA